MANTAFNGFHLLVQNDIQNVGKLHWISVRNKCPGDWMVMVLYAYELTTVVCYLTHNITRLSKS